jgi:hypothetical protein
MIIWCKKKIKLPSKILFDNNFFKKIKKYHLQIKIRTKPLTHLHLDFIYFCISKIFLKKFNFFLYFYFELIYFLDYVLILKIIF